MSWRGRMEGCTEAAEAAAAEVDAPVLACEEGVW
jgi:hypothetical protein